jgi:hypothetical protein
MSLGLVTKIVSAEEFDRHFPTVKPGLLYLSRYEIPNGPNLFSIYVLTYDTESDSYWDRLYLTNGSNCLMAQLSNRERQ